MTGFPFLDGYNRRTPTENSKIGPEWVTVKSVMDSWCDDDVKVTRIYQISLVKIDWCP